MPGRGAAAPAPAQACAGDDDGDGKQPASPGKGTSDEGRRIVHAWIAATEGECRLDD